MLGKKEMERLHQKHLKKSGSTTVLSFPLSKNSGEILLCPFFIKKKKNDYGLNFKTALEKMFVHGLLHLKGLKHSKEMEKKENEFLKSI